MIAQLTGTIIELTDLGVILEVGGVGYEVLGSKLMKEPLGTKLTIYTLYHVSSDNNPSLYGFSAPLEKQLFLKLLTVPGIGPKSAMRVLNSDNFESIVNAIDAGDASYFKRVKGLGTKAAQKIILELKNKLVLATSPRDSMLYDALVSLKFTRAEIATTISSVDLTGLSDSESLKKVLREIGKR